MTKYENICYGEVKELNKQLREENERLNKLNQELLGKPVGVTEWEKLVAENERLKAENAEFKLEKTLIRKEYMEIMIALQSEITQLKAQLQSSNCKSESKLRKCPRCEKYKNDGSVPFSIFENCALCNGTGVLQEPK